MPTRRTSILKLLYSPHPIRREIVISLHFLAFEGSRFRPSLTFLSDTHHIPVP